jgi:hypothetical protein
VFFLQKLAETKEKLESYNTSFERENVSRKTFANFIFQQIHDYGVAEEI